jgi:MSHA biogenesis protein MshM
MDAYEHFKLKKPPFDPRPDIDFFFATPAHAEVLATLQYVVATGKGCCVVVGESGCGKTLLAQLVAATAANTTTVLWVHGGAQPHHQTNVSLYSSPSHVRNRGGAFPQKTTLAAETHGTIFRSEPPLLIVDCADELPNSGWADVVAWFSNELRYPKPANVLLFGLPRLVNILTSAELIRLRRRVFRTCRLELLTPELSKDYIRGRIALAGGDADRIFSDGVIEQISELGKGNPALISQLCDNALVEAFGQGCDRVTPTDVSNALEAVLMERLKEHTALPAPLQRARRALPPAWSSMTGHAPQPAHAASRVWDGWISAPQVGGVQDAVDVRLRHLAQRVSQALGAIRQAEDGLDQEAFLPEASGVRVVAAESTTI